jgi:hypothetical protein
MDAAFMSVSMVPSPVCGWNPLSRMHGQCIAGPCGLLHNVPQSVSSLLYLFLARSLSQACLPSLGMESWPFSVTGNECEKSQWQALKSQPPVLVLLYKLQLQVDHVDWDKHIASQVPTWRQDKPHCTRYMVTGANGPPSQRSGNTKPTIKKAWLNGW